MTPIRRISRIAMLIFAAALTSPLPALADLLRADEVLRRTEKSATASKGESQSKAAELLADIKRFRAQSDGMEARQAALAWLDLYDRAEKLGRINWQGEFREFDLDTANAVGMQSVFAALPPPAAWPELRKLAGARAERAPQESRALSLRLLAELLTADLRAGAVTLAQIERLAANLPPTERETARAQAGQVRAEVARLHGTPDEIAATFVGSLDAESRRAFRDVAVPDLVGLVGESKASALLADALAKPVRLHVPEGDATRALARRTALEQLARLRVPQWGLVDSMEGAELYEALQRRFVGAGGDGAKEGEPLAEERYAFRKGEADVYYFLSLVVKGRQADAERALRTIAGGQELVIPKRAVDALQRAGYDEALFNFLHGLLGRRPELRAWGVYTREAAFTGNSAAALALVDGLLKRKDLPDFVLADLRFHRVNALVAADKVDPALAALRELLATPPKRDERTLQARADAAVRLAGLGRILKRRDLADTGLAFAGAVLALPGGEREGSWERERLLREVFAEQRKLGLAERAQALAIAELARGGESANELEQYGIGGGPGNERAAIIELAGIYGEAKRYREVVLLLDGSSKWRARDVRALAAEKDSLGVPLGLTAARALSETGNAGAALALVRVLINALPGYDPAYELLVSLDKDANDYLNHVYARDRYEERPLIWKAIVLSHRGRYVEAESLIRNAITIDPSDGEQGPSDRMRAYAVLADILDATGAKESAAQYRKAVTAIRISERSDELHKLGLYQRAFAGYREALENFADAYCIQSRLAVRLNEQGQRQEAFEHYRRAYELMPASFGRVESHCFGCESVFQGPAAQGIAERVFNELLVKDPKKPQVHYLLGYLHKEQGRFGDALPRFREAVNLDGEYLNAWKQLHELGRHVYIEARERDLARLKLLELDPRQRHVNYDLASIGDLTLLWHAVESAGTAQKDADDKGALYPLRRSAAVQDEALAKLPEAMRDQVEQYQAMGNAGQESRTVATPRQALARHSLVKAVASLMGGEPGRQYE